MFFDENEYDYICKDMSHDHEFEGSVFIAERGEDPHNHRFAGETGRAIPYKKSHYHKLETKTDFYEDHLHEIFDKTGPAIYVGGGKHVHFAKGRTTENDGHKHKFEVATLIENPIGNDNNYDGDYDNGYDNDYDYDNGYDYDNNCGDNHKKCRKY